MLLVDSSVWIDYLRQDDHALSDLLANNGVLIHPMIVGELSIGILRDRDAILKMLNELPEVIVAAHDEVLQFIETHKLFGRGIGYIDANLLASARLTPDAMLWTRDRRLHEAAKMLSLAAKPTH